MKKRKIIVTILMVVIIIYFSLFSLMYFIVSQTDWEDYYQSQLTNEIKTIDFPGGYYHLYQERSSPDDPWTTHLDMYTNFCSKYDVFSYIDYQRGELNNSFSDPEFEDKYLELDWLGFRELLPIDRVKEFLETFVSKENALFTIVYFDQTSNQSRVEEVYSIWEQDPQGFDVKDLKKANNTIRGILGLTSVITTDAGKLLISDPRVLLLETLQGNDIRLLMQKYSPHHVSRKGSPFWQEYVKWVGLWN